MSDLSPKQLVREAAKILRQEENAVAREVKVREKEQVRADKLLANEQSKKEKADAKLEVTTEKPKEAKVESMNDCTDEEYQDYLDEEATDEYLSKKEDYDNSRSRYNWREHGR